MNLLYPIRNLILYLVFLLIPALVSAQFEYHEILVNSSLDYNFESVGNPAQIEQAPNNGDYWLNGNLNAALGSTGTNELIYIPNLDFIGSDTIEILYYINDDIVGPTASFVTLVIDVVESYVIAVNDYAATSINTPVSIDVTSNDISAAELTLSNIPLANQGTAVINNGFLEFTPYLNFKGIANLTYTVCDDVNAICDVATVTIFVQDGISENDSTTLVTLKNESLRALFSTSEGVQELLSPKYGEIILMDGGVDYVPNTDFVGKDTFSYAYDINTTTSIATFIVDVLDKEEENTILVEDYNYTPILDSTEFNVLDNDLNQDLSVLSYTQSDRGGEVLHLGNGLFKYIAPTNGFSGIDFFEYTAGIPGTATQETGKAFIEVSNQLPSADEFSLFTPKNTPIVIDYDLPFSNYSFEIITQSDFGEVIYYPGFNSLEVNGQLVEGNNLVVYYPDSDYTGTDAFSLEYCVGTDCKTIDVLAEVQTVNNPQADTLCVSNCVWPGDTNADGVVNVADVLPLGYCVGEVGFERDSSSIEWYGQFAEEWDGMIGNTGINVKHVDANGDGYISDLDTAAIYESYGVYSSKITPSPAPELSQIPLFFVPQTPNAGPGDKVFIDIVLGTEDLPATDIHGITFALNFNQDIVEAETMEVLYTNDNWLAYESTMLSMMKEPTIGRVESGYTRSSGISNHGYGVIGQVSFIVVDDLVDGIRLRDTLSVPVFPSSILSMNAAGQYKQLVSQNFDLKFSHDVSEKFDDDNRNLITYPNPTTGFLNIHVNGNNELEQIIVHSLTGQEVYRSSDDLSGKKTNIEFGTSMANGIYLVTAICDKGVYTKKVELIRE